MLILRKYLGLRHKIQRILPRIVHNHRKTHRHICVKIINAIYQLSRLHNGIVSPIIQQLFPPGKNKNIPIFLTFHKLLLSSLTHPEIIVARLIQGLTAHMNHRCIFTLILHNNGNLLILVGIIQMIIENTAITIHHIRIENTIFLYIFRTIRKQQGPSIIRNLYRPSFQRLRAVLLAWLPIYRIHRMPGFRHSITVLRMNTIHIHVNSQIHYILFLPRLQLSLALSRRNLHSTLILNWLDSHSLIGMILTMYPGIGR